MNKKRDRLGLIFDILKIISQNNNSIRPTPLLRKSNLSSKTFSEYYSDLLSKGFIKELIDGSGGKHVTLTDKGYEYLEKYKFILGFMEEFEL